VHELIGLNAQRFPERIAVQCGASAATYGELHAKSTAFGARLRDAGVGADDVVGLHVDRSIEMLIGLLGILHAEAAYMPLDPSYPRARNLALTAHADCAAIVVTPDRADHGLGAMPTITLDDLDAGGHRRTPTGSGGNRGRRAYVISTSGTTGVPKAIITTHDNIMNFLVAMRDIVQLDETDVVFARTSLAFDPHTIETMLPLLVGARIVVSTQCSPPDPAALREEIFASGATLVQAMPGLWRSLVHDGWDPPHPMKTLCGGEPLSESLKNAILAGGKVRLWNLYGPTETTVYCSAQEMHASEPPRISARPIPGLRFEVRTSDGTPCADGETGELHISGRGLAEGYLNQPELTAERFVVSSNATNGAERWYRTGDLVQAFADGTYEFVGRADRQVKVRGYRIELDEIEAAIRSVDGVQDAVAIARDSMLVAAVLGREPRAEHDARLLERVRAQLGTLLPDFMTPSRMVVVDEIPLTPTEKVDNEAIMARALRRDAPGEPLPAGDAIVAGIVDIWQKILGVREVYADDRFFDIGGHSLNAVEVQLRIFHEFNVHLPLHAVIANQTVLELRSAVDDALGAGVAVQAAAAGTYPLAPSQYRFFLETPPLDVDGNVLPLLVRTTHPREVVRHAVDTIVGRHEVFRVDGVRFDVGGGEQHLAETARPGVEDVTDCYASTEEFLAAMAAGARELCVAEGRLFRWSIYAAREETFVHCVLHHLLADDISYDVIKREMEALLADAMVRLPPATSFVGWMDAFGNDTALEAARADLTAWEAMVCRDRVDAFTGDAPETTDDRLARSVARWSCISAGLTSLDRRSREHALLSASVHALASVFDLQQVGCRMVDGGRGLSAEFDDGLGVGWLSFHYPLVVRRGDDARATAQSLRDARAALGSRGETYAWLRYRAQEPSLVNGVQLGELPLYFNYMPRLARTQQFVDVTDLLPSTVFAHQRITGLALVIRDRDDDLEITVFHNPDTVFETSVQQFLEQLPRNVQEIVDPRSE
jgi:amino acid adenylation domain-containing protein